MFVELGALFAEVEVLLFDDGFFLLEGLDGLFFLFDVAGGVGDFVGELLYWTSVSPEGGAGDWCIPDLLRVLLLLSQRVQPLPLHFQLNHKLLSNPLNIIQRLSVLRGLEDIIELLLKDRRFCQWPVGILLMAEYDVLQYGL